ncbi:lipopolysaccharide biosynthesis protein [Roseiflexus sp.]|uniref:lipopolysaccharide biosynthesis protein n=1 Tax=Roseiflexus sp. TaxID=2562120 RepID=UPI00398A828D
MITPQELLRLLRPILRWWWLIPIAVLLSGSVAFLVSRTETRYYVARSTLMIGNTLESQRPDPIQLQLGSSLGRFYGELAKRERILQPVQEKLNLPFSWNVIATYMLRTAVVPNANLLEIYITDSNPVRAAAIANAIADQLIAYSPTSPDKVAAEQMTIEQQLRESEARLNDLRARIEETTFRRQQVVSASDLAEINQTLMQLEASLSREQETYNRLLSFKNSSVVNVLTPFESAEPPLAPLPSRRNITILFAGLGGFLIAVAAAYVLDRVDPRLRGPEDVRERVDMAVLGNVPKGPPIQSIVGARSEQRIAALRQVQTNLMLAAREEGIHALLITSALPNEGRSAVSADLADLFARAGHRVLLVDAEPTQPYLSRLLNAEPDLGRPWTRLRSEDRQELLTHIIPVAVSNMAFLPVAPTYDAQPAMLSSRRWHELTHLFTSIADIVIFDGPATMTGPDAALLAPHTDGVVVVIDPYVEAQELIIQSKQRLQKDQRTHVMGAVLLEPSALEASHRPLLGAWPWQRRPSLPDGNGAVASTEDGDAHEPSRPATEGKPVVFEVDTSHMPEAEHVIITPPPDPHEEDRQVIVTPPPDDALHQPEADTTDPPDQNGKIQENQNILNNTADTNANSSQTAAPAHSHGDMQPHKTRRKPVASSKTAGSRRRSGSAKSRTRHG